MFLLERYFYFLEQEKQHGLLVTDEVDKTEDRRFVRRLERYFRKTTTGRYRSTWIVPAPFFVSSDLTYPVQAADLAIYCVNWGFRLPTRGMDAPSRPEIADDSPNFNSVARGTGTGMYMIPTASCSCRIPTRPGRVGNEKRRQCRRSHPKAAPKSHSFSTLPRMTYT